MSKNNYIKSPLNYVGGKYKLLPQIEPLFPKNIRMFVDLFCGGGNVSVNSNAEIVLANDKEKVVVDLLSNLSSDNSVNLLHKLKETINTYELSKTNEEGFYKIRQDYNNGNRSWDMFYAMLTHAFNYQIRFNKNNEYNMPFGKNRSSFNPKLEENFIKFVDKLNVLNIKFTNKDFRELKVDKLTNRDFVYIDPPYLITLAAYNESGGWTEKDEYDLYELCDKLHSKGIKFAVSNVTYHKGKQNDILIEWSKKYNIHNLNHSYGNSNYHTKDKSKDSSQEVLITNY